jgi:hypothetical protein
VRFVDRAFRFSRCEASFRDLPLREVSRIESFSAKWKEKSRFDVNGSGFGRARLGQLAARAGLFDEMVEPELGRKG